MTPTNDAPVTVERWRTSIDIPVVEQRHRDAAAWAMDRSPDGLTWEAATASHITPEKRWQMKRVAEAMARMERDTIARHRLAALASAPAGDGEYRVNPDRSGLERMTMTDDEMGLPDEPMPLSPNAVPAWHGEAVQNALLASSKPVERTKLGDLPSRIQGWIGKARARGGDRIELNFATVELLLAAALARPRAAVGEREALEDLCAAMEYWAGCDEGVVPDVATSEIMSAGGAWPATAYDKARAILALQSPPAKVEGV